MKIAKHGLFIGIERFDHGFKLSLKHYNEFQKLAVYRIGMVATLIRR